MEGLTISGIMTVGVIHCFDVVLPQRFTRTSCRVGESGDTDCFLKSRELHVTDLQRWGCGENFWLGRFFTGLKFNQHMTLARNFGIPPHQTVKFIRQNETKFAALKR